MLGALLAALLLNVPAMTDVRVIGADDARVWVGHDVVVQGQVTQVGASEDGDTLFLNFGGRYPDQVFNAVIFKRNLQSFPEARSWEGKIIKVRGKIQLYKGRGKPEIILEHQEQVAIDSSPTLPQGAVDDWPVTDKPYDYDSPPRPIKITRPQYPQEAFLKKVEGTVVLEILIDSQGRVVRARVIQSVPLLDAAALETVYQWIFQPAVKDGRPVPTIGHAPVAFRIYGQAPEEQRKQVPANGPVQPVAEMPPPKPAPGNMPCAFPAEAQRSRVAGPVLYTAQVRPDGTVESVEIRQVPAQDLGFEAAVRTCVSRWRFEPATGNGGLRQYDGKVQYRIAMTAEVAVRALLEAFASAWNSNNAEVIGALQGGRQQAEASDLGSPLSLPDQFARERTAADWNMELDPDFQEVRFLRSDVAVVRQPFHRRGRGGVGAQNDQQLSLLEATAIKRGESWTLLGWYPIAGPPPSPGQRLFPGVEEPRKVKHVDPIYPDLALQARVEAVVVVEVVVDSAGHVASVRILRGHPLFDEAVREAVKKWDYTPALLAGAPIPVAMTVSIEFQWDSRRGRVIVREPVVSEPSVVPPPSQPSKTSDATAQSMGGLYFDPQGADFTLWINAFKNEVYRNWIVPQAALFGARGHVDFEFTVERNGSMSALRMLKSSGTPAFDKAAEFALTASKFAVLPHDYHPPRVTMQVTFIYNEAPQ